MARADANGEAVHGHPGATSTECALLGGRDSERARCGIGRDNEYDCCGIGRKPGARLGTTTLGDSILTDVDFAHGMDNPGGAGKALAAMCSLALRSRTFASAHASCIASSFELICTSSKEILAAFGIFCIEEDMTSKFWAESLI